MCPFGNSGIDATTAITLMAAIKKWSDRDGRLAHYPFLLLFNARRYEGINFFLACLYWKHQYNFC